MNKHSSKPVKAAFTALIVAFMTITGATLYQKMAERQHSQLPVQVRLMTAVSETGGGIVEVDPLTMEITSATAAADALFGYPRNGLAGRSLDVLVPDWFRNEHREIILHRNPASTGIEIIQCQAVKKDGSFVSIATMVFSNQISGRLVALVIPGDKMRSHYAPSVARNSQP